MGLTLPVLAPQAITHKENSLGFQGLQERQGSNFLFSIFLYFIKKIDRNDAVYLASTLGISLFALFIGQFSASERFLTGMVSTGRQNPSRISSEVFEETFFSFNFLPNYFGHDGPSKFRTIGSLR